MSKIKPTLIYEQAFGQNVCGIDEVGRGCIAGPVVAAALIWKDFNKIPPNIYDSKTIDKVEREQIALNIYQHAFIGLGSASVFEIDNINILKASFLAMQRALTGLCLKPSHALVDGNQKPPVNVPLTCIVKGDSLSLSIAAASIVAKVYRDRLMRNFAKQYSSYGFEKNAGYGTQYHLEMIKKYGYCPIHRKTFAPIRQIGLI